MLEIITAAPAPILQIDGSNITGIVVGVLGLIGVVYTGRSAYLTAKARAEAEAAAAASLHDTTAFDQNLALGKYVDARADARVAAETADLREEIRELKEQFGAVRGKLARTREAFREFIRDVYEKWGHATHPPTIPAHVRDLLAEDDLDGTFSRAEVRDRIATEQAIANSTERSTP